MSLYPSYARPRTLAQADSLLSELSSGAVIIAGGQELMPYINDGTLEPDVYVDIGGLKELTGITFDGESGMLSVGALTVHRTVQTDTLVAQYAPLLAHAAVKAGGGRQVHNRGTIGGNIVSMHPLYDINPPLLALGAQVEMMKKGALSIMSLGDLLTDTTHGLGSDAILTRVIIPAQQSGSGYGYEKLKTSGGAYGSANAAAMVAVEGGVITALSLAIGASADAVVNASAAAQFCVGQAFTPALALQLESTCAAAITAPLSDQQGSGDWRKAMAGVVARRAVQAAFDMASQARQEAA